MPPTLIGRDSQLAEIERLIAAVGRGAAAPRTLLVSGEAGIGKSRLVAALRELAAPPWAALASACFEPYQAEPYAPIVDMLGRPHPEPLAARIAAALGPTSDALALLPGLAGRLAPGATAGPGADSAENQRLIIRGLTGLFARLAAEAPLLISIENLHWSDAATLVFLPILAHALAELPALLVLTYRADEAGPPLAAALAELDRRRLAAEIALPRLTRAEVAALVRGPLGAPAGPAMLDTLYELTEGNPFFVEEVVLAMPAEAWGDEARQLPIPRSVHEAVARRSGRLGPEARELLTLAAALGRRFDFAVLEHVTGRDEGALLAQLKELIAARLIVEESADQFAFRHALARAAVYGDLLARERRALHRRLGEALEPALGEAHAADLARHFFLGEQWALALRYALAAAGQAWNLYALRDALAHQTRALEAAAHLPAEPRAPLLAARAATHNILGDFEAARADLDAALADARARGRPADEWRVLVGLGELWTARDYGRAGDYFAQALGHARAMEEPAPLARSLNSLGVWHMNEERPRTAEAMHREALALYEEAGDRRGQAESLERLGVTRLFMADAAGGVGCFERAAAHYRALDDQVGLSRVRGLHCLRVNAANEPLDIAALQPVGGELLDLLALIRGQGLRAQEGPLLQVLAGELILAGEYGRAAAFLRESIAICEELGYYEWQAYALAWRGALALELREPAEAVRWCEGALAAARRVGATFVLRVVAYHLVRAYTAAGSPAEAAAALEAALRPAGERNEPSLLLRRLRLAGAELAVARGEPGRALAELDDLVATAVNPAGKVIPVLWCARGEALAALGRHDEAGPALREGLEAARAEGRRPLALRLLAAIAALAAARRRHEEAAAAVEEAHALVDALAATLDDPAQRAGYRQRARAALPAPPLVTPRQAVKQVFGGLTDRELDVARLIARGHTNREIAEALVLSERTVGAHVGNILAKLGFSSRLQVARWAIEKGIAR